MTQNTSALRLAAALRHYGVECGFGLPGTQTVELFDALRQVRLRTILATSELAAAFMAGGWARATGRPAVLLTIPGPGFVWALPGVAEALLDSLPLLHISGAPPSRPAGRRFRQQELAQSAIASPLVKCVIEWDGRSDIADDVRNALAATTAGEPGPVLLHVDCQVLGQELPPGLSPLFVEPAVVENADLGELKRRVAAAARPLLLAGQGTTGHSDLLRTVAEVLRAPVLTTPSARGVLAEDHPLHLGFDPFAGNLAEANSALERADLTLVLGAKLGHNGTCGFRLSLPARHLIHVDTNPDVIGANYPVSMAVVEDARVVLEALRASAVTASDWDSAEIAQRRDRIRQLPGLPLEPMVAGTPEGTAAGFFAALRRALPRDAVLVLDSGMHQIMARRHFPVFSDRGLMFPSDLQSMGFAIPTAIGAKLALPDRPVVALLGDGGFAMTGLELLSAVREGLSLTVIVFADGQLGQIRLHQIAEYGVSHSVTLNNPDFALLAESMGVRYAFAERDVERVIRDAVTHTGVTLVEVPVGDSFGIRRAVVSARVRGVVRNVAPRGLRKWLKRLAIGRF